jgi:hypothetical protein
LNGPNIIKYHQISRGNLGQKKQIQSVRWMLAKHLSTAASMSLNLCQLKLSLGVQAPTTLPVPAPTHAMVPNSSGSTSFSRVTYHFGNAILPSLLLFGRLFQCVNKLSERPGFWLSFY